MQECNRCLLRESVPGVIIKEDGICSVCHQHDVKWGNWESVKDRQLVTLKKMFDDCRRKKEFMMFWFRYQAGKTVLMHFICAGKNLI